MVSCFEVPFTAVAALVDAEKHFPPKTPKRWDLIAEYVRKSNEALKGSTPTVTAEPAMVLGNAAVTPTKFLFSNDHCKLLFAILNTTYKHLLGYADQQAAIIFSDPTFKPVILLPRKLTCCGRPVYIK